MPTSAQNHPTPPPSHALIVGGTRGLGRALAKRLASEPAWRISALARNLPPEPIPGVSYFAGDIHDRATREQAFAAAVAANGPLNAILFCQRYRGTDNAWAGEISVTLTATMESLEWASSHFASNGPRSAVLVGSVAGRSIVDDQPAGYHVAKAGVESLARYYAVKWGPAGIRVNVVAPSAFIKEESREYYETHPDAMGRWTKLSPLQRMGTTEDVADAVIFLSSARASFITGQTLVVDGGMGLKLPSDPE